MVSRPSYNGREKKRVRSAREKRRDETSRETNLLLDLLILILLLNDGSLGVIVHRLMLDVESDLNEGSRGKREKLAADIGMRRVKGKTRNRLTSSRIAILHLIRALKSPFPRTFRSSMLALTSPVVCSDFNQLCRGKRVKVKVSSTFRLLASLPPKRRDFEENEYSRLLLGLLESHPVNRSERHNGILGVDELADSDLLEEGESSVLVTLSLSPLLLGSEDVGVSVSSRSTLLVEGHEGGEILEDVSRVEELGIDVCGSEEVSADDENLGGNVTEKDEDGQGCQIELGESWGLDQRAERSLKLTEKKEVW